MNKTLINDYQKSSANTNFQSHVSYFQKELSCIQLFFSTSLVPHDASASL